MKRTEKIKATVEAVGMSAVVLSQIFVGMEIRQNTVATKSATQQALLQSGMTSNMNVMNNPTLRYWREMHDAFMPSFQAFVDQKYAEAGITVISQ